MKDVLSEGWDNCVSHVRDTAIDQVHEPRHKTLEPHHRNTRHGTDVLALWQVVCHGTNTGSASQTW